MRMPEKVAADQVCIYKVSKTVSSKLHHIEKSEIRRQIVSHLILICDVTQIQLKRSIKKEIIILQVTRSILKKDKRRSDPWDFLLYGPVIY